MSLKLNREQSDPLCCCEYINANGQRSHVLGFLCDCAELDDTVDRLFAGQSVPKSKVLEIWNVLEDRSRVPWWRGAQPVPLDVVVPWILVPLGLWLAQWNVYVLVVVHALMLPSLYIWYRLIWRFKPHNRFYTSWSVATTCVLFYVYEFEVVGFIALPKTISFWENLVLIGSGLLAIFFVKETRRRSLWVQKLGHPQRSERFCRICETSVVGRKHHCFWIGICISESNQRHFMGFLVSLCLTLVQYSLLSLTSVCQSYLVFYDLVLVPSDCAMVNDKFEGNPNLVWASGIHSGGIAILIFTMIVVKICR
ncbi:hypothetical protein TCAL_06153 [Tigriopus californicus]|uniref:Palmitoyltransferase n=2 Tax=Tigriopus californicus TaxID=6832 RepID=A0A553PL90_TIGCA|nr:hypothetical protein TCAL_06153 [Tigriopus californicus]|eukprot:TCALIF_06153-PA protein Name:"Similar to Zdhhc23 Palmitoyltransferase ZDHHC23 (Mus musculus)" AED:0.34 eAED:0.34 QI:0/-1/0/1/-1/1/1/0/308